MPEFIDLELRDLRPYDPRSVMLTAMGGKTSVVLLASKMVDLILSNLADKGIDVRDQPCLA